MRDRPDHELDELEIDSSVPPRPEEEAAEASRASTSAGSATESATASAPESALPEPQNQPAAGGHDDGAPAQGEGQPDSQ